MGIVSLRERDAIDWHDAERARRGACKHAPRIRPVAKSGNRRERTRVAHEPGQTAECAPGERQRQELST